MRITATTEPRLVATPRKGVTLHIRVISGTIRISGLQQDLIDGGGLEISTSDNIVSLVWESGALWVAGTNAVYEVIVP